MPDQIMLEEGAGLHAPNLHLNGIVNAVMTDGRENCREFTHLVLNIQTCQERKEKKAFLFSGETPNAESNHAGCL